VGLMLGSGRTVGQRQGRGADRILAGQLGRQDPGRAIRQTGSWQGRGADNRPEAGQAVDLRQKRRGDSVPEAGQREGSRPGGRAQGRQWA
jgi:hypothetical protein